ncbi:hypothetical protein O181_027226 [Austropuccinia psidii MF-1]|uniref:Reverse transcriptase domain-containing protein n=1 Tax=Austropuccinia psidii MF-1 TaxID=1389203 RepID=A0A9Q3H191_9BASI|nr:hypothetical protein [Austropuccinia psidii MF-1]
MKLNQITSDNTRQTELWQELKQTEDSHKTYVINSIQSLQHEFRNSQRCNNSKMNDIEQLLHTLPRMSTPLNQNEGTRIPSPQVLEVESSQLGNEFCTSFHKLEPSMGQALLKEVPKLKEWPHFSGKAEYDHMKFIRGIDMIEEDFELPDRLVTERFNTLFTRSAHRWYIKLRQAHGHQSWTWWKTQTFNKWANDAWRFKVEAAFESAKFNAGKDKYLPWFCQQKDRLTAFYPDMSEFMIHRKILRQCGGDLEHAVKRRTTEQSSSEDIISILEEVTTRTRIGSSRVNLKTRFHKPWKDSMDKNSKANSNNVKYKSADIIRKCHICQSTTQLANTCPKRGKINEIYIEKEPYVEKDDNIIEENSDDKSSIFSESSNDIENINATFDIMESYSHLPQLSNGQLYLSKIQDSQLMKTKPNRGKHYTAGAFCSCVGKSFLKTCVPNFEDQLLPIDGMKFNSASNPMKALGIFETNVIFPHIHGNLRITVEFVVMENCSSIHFILGNDYLVMYGIDLHNKKYRYFTIGDNKCQRSSFLPFKRQITVSKVAPINLELERFKSEQLHEAEISLHVTNSQENELSALSYDHKEAFSSDKEALGKLPAYPASSKSREALEIHIKELLDLGVMRKVDHNEEVEIPKPVIVAWHNGKSRVVGDFRALNTYTVPDRYPIPKIQIALTQISQAVYIATMDALKVFHQNVVTLKERKYLRIIVHCGVYEYLRMPFGINNAPSHFQRIMNEIFPEELSEGWLFI